MKKIKNIILFVFITSILSAITTDKVNAQIKYGGGETEIINKRFSIEKKVAKYDEDHEKDEDDLDYEDKVTGVEEDDIVVFRIRVKNKTDEEFDGDFDEMKYEDFLPDEMYRVGGSGLTEYWDDFEPDEEETFYIRAKVEEDEYDRDENFDKCVVNKVKLYWDDEFEGSDTATVCYGEDADDVEELPETGFVSVLTIFGFMLILSGVVIKLHKKFAK